MLVKMETFTPQGRQTVNDQLIQNLLQQISDQLGRGPATAWTDYDFEHLSEEIFAATDTRLSVTTLQRAWGRLKHSSKPSTTTLNALAGYAGYADWRAFKRTSGAEKGGQILWAGSPERNSGAEEDEEERKKEETEDSEKPLEFPIGNFLKFNLGLFALLALLVTVAVLLLKETIEKPAEVDMEELGSMVDKVRALCVHGTVAFPVDATAAGNERPVCIGKS